jgi:hypothetical protein
MILPFRDPRMSETVLMISPVLEWLMEMNHGQYY